MKYVTTIRECEYIILKNRGLVRINIYSIEMIIFGLALIF